MLYLILFKLRAAADPIESEPSDDPSSHIQQLRILKLAYESATPKEPYLPTLGSPIPALLAIRGTNKCIHESLACATSMEVDFQDAQKQLETEQADLKDANLIHAGLKARIEDLEGEMRDRTQKSPGQIAKEMIKDIKRKQHTYDSGTSKLVKAFNEFVDAYLAPMLAAEELGGPVVGDILDVEDEMLVAGFSTQGKVKRLKKEIDEGKRQQRINVIWGSRPEADAPQNESQAAAAEMKDLTEALLNRAVEIEHGGQGIYIDLLRESAAARFLVRSKVAQFHPRDATKLKIIDFGGELED